MDEAEFAENERELNACCECEPTTFGWRARPFEAESSEEDEVTEFDECGWIDQLASTEV